MPVSNYRVLYANTPEELSAAVGAAFLAPVGQSVPHGFIVLQAAGNGFIDEFGDVTSYKLLQDLTLDGLASKVNDHISQGYQPIGGGVVPWGRVFMQGVGVVSHAPES